MFLQSNQNEKAELLRFMFIFLLILEYFTSVEGLHSKIGPSKLIRKEETLLRFCYCEPILWGGNI